MIKKCLVQVIFVVLIIFFSGCENNKIKKINEESTPHQISSGVLSIEDPWIRPASSGTNTALFFKVINSTNKPDTLYGAESELAEIVEVHETYQKGADMMGMRHVGQVVVPSGATIEFKPRDLHVMFIRLYDNLLIADSGDAVLLFKNAGKVKIKAVVRDMPIMRE